MEFLKQYAPYLLIACGVIGALVPTLTPQARSWFSRFSSVRKASSPSNAELQLAYVTAVLTAMESCRNADCTKGVDTAKSLLGFVDQIHSEDPCHA